MTNLTQLSDQCFSRVTVRDNDMAQDAADAGKMGIFVTEKPSYWQTLLGSSTTLPSVPSVGGLISR